MTRNDQPNVLMNTDLPLSGKRAGKVRDTYECSTTDGEPAMLLVATDRISAFDVIMANGIPGKGTILTSISRFWFDMIERKFADKLDHHLLGADPAMVAGLGEGDIAALAGRVMVSRRAHVVPIECVVRGYLAGSGWKEYQQSGTVCGVELPSGLQLADKLPEPILTPATKAAEGHDENITFERACEVVGEPLMAQLRELSISIYEMGRSHAADRGIILADTKFEFGLADAEDPASLLLIDEVMTPDSSRFWPADQWQPGTEPASFDKQFVRNYLQGLVDAGSWDKTPPGPTLPDDVVAGTIDRYEQARDLLTK